MAGLAINWNEIQEWCRQDIAEVMEMLGIESIVILLPRRSFWQQLKDEIKARPRVF